MSPSEKSSYRIRLVFAFALSLAMALSLPLLTAIRFPHYSPLLNRPNFRPVLILIILNSAIFLTIPAVLLLRLVRSKRNTGSYFPTGDRLNKYRTRRRQPKPLGMRITSAAFELIAAISFSIDAAHKPHKSPLEWGAASLFLLSAVATLLAISQNKKVGRREGFACPECGVCPPVGDKWRCKQCAKLFDTFLCRAVCPHCGTQHPTTMCGSCQKSHPMNDWIYSFIGRNSGAGTN
jgi:hypothetical protein